MNDVQLILIALAAGLAGGSAITWLMIEAMKLNYDERLEALRIQVVALLAREGFDDD